MKTKSLVILLILIFANIACAQQNVPRNVAICDENKKIGQSDAIDSLLTEAIISGVINGGVVCVASADSILFLRAYGNKQVYPDTLPMNTNTIFDLASLSKSTSTAMCVFALLKENKLSLNEKVSKYVPEINDEFTIVHLLTHTSGLPPYLNVNRLLERYADRDDRTLADCLLDSICHCPRSPFGVKYRYSCLNYILLQHVLENIEEKPLCDIAREKVFEPLDMKYTTYLPDSILLPLIAPTELVYVDSDSVVLHGVVHDPLARVMNAGNSGNAGVFSCAEDLTKLAQYLLQNKNDYYVQQMSNVPDSLAFSERTLGWQINTDDLRYTGTLFSNHAYCHTGYTGTSMIIDPDNNLCLILLTNRVHPHDKGNLTPLRASLADVVMSEWRKDGR